MANASRSTVFAAVGDVHGRMRSMIRLVEQKAKKLGREVDFVLQVGDFEPHRDEADVASMDAPARYRQLGEFPAFHQGRERLPWPVYFIGGNHEPHRLLEVLPDGGEVAPSCRYLGRVGLHEARGVRVLGLSGIYREEALCQRRPGAYAPGFGDYPYFNELDIDRALSAERVEVLMVHEWPKGLLAEGEVPARMRRASSPEAVGNEMARLLAEHLAPQLVVCGHMHVAHRARIHHAQGKPATPVACLASVEAGEGAVALFERRVDGVIEEV